MKDKVEYAARQWHRPMANYLSPVDYVEKLSNDYSSLKDAYLSLIQKTQVLRSQIEEKDKIIEDLSTKVHKNQNDRVYLKTYVKLTKSYKSIFRRLKAVYRDENGVNSDYRVVERIWQDIDELLNGNSDIE